MVTDGSHRLSEMSGMRAYYGRLSEMMSSSLRFHLSMVFTEEEGGNDELLQSIQTRVKEHAAAYGFTLGGGEGCDEHFSAVVGHRLPYMAAALRWEHS